MIYCKCLERECSLTYIKAWYKGESLELDKWMGFGFYNHLFVSENGVVTLYYEEGDGERFHEVLNEKLTKEFFNDLCDKFFELIDKSESLNTDTELFDLLVNCWLIFTIFDEISKYPEFATPSMIQRLFRVRRTTESFSYELSKRIKNHEYADNYIFYKGELIIQPFKDFLKENDIVIKL